MPSDTQTPPVLQRLRQDIDAVDDQILELLLKRFDLGQAVADAKRNMPPAPNMRPAREAEILRRLASRWRGPAPVSTVAAIWRHIISTVLGLQGTFTVHLTEEDREVTPPLAANHFSAGAHFRDHPTYERALAAAADDIQSIAILALPKGNPPSPWWRPLHQGPLRIVARLPFLTPANASAFVVARQEAVSSGDDISLARIAGGGRAWTEVGALFPGFRLLATDGDRYLAEQDGFWEAGDIARFQVAAAPLAMEFQPIGAYARPLQLSRTSS
jgi:chorismate mutase